MTLCYVAVGPCVYAFADTREEAVALVKPIIPWGLVPLSRKDVVVSTYAYLPEQDLSVCKITGRIAWDHADKFDVRASEQTTVVPRG